MGFVVLLARSALREDTEENKINEKGITRKKGKKMKGNHYKGARRKNTGETFATINCLGKCCVIRVAKQDLPNLPNRDNIAEKIRQKMQK